MYFSESQMTTWNVIFGKWIPDTTISPVTSFGGLFVVPRCQEIGRNSRKQGDKVKKTEKEKTKKYNKNRHNFVAVFCWPFLTIKLGIFEVFWNWGSFLCNWNPKVGRKIGIRERQRRGGNAPSPKGRKQSPLSKRLTPQETVSTGGFPTMMSCTPQKGTEICIPVFGVFQRQNPRKYRPKPHRGWIFSSEESRSK